MQRRRQHSVGEKRNEGHALAPRDRWQKLRDRGLEMVGRLMRAPGGLVDVELEDKESSVKNSQVLDLESRNGALWKSSLPGNCFAEGDSLQISFVILSLKNDLRGTTCGHGND